MGRWLKTAAVAGLALAWGAAGAAGAMTWVWFNEFDPDRVIGEVEIVNDSDGAVYDSYKIQLADLAAAIYAANPRLQGGVRVGGGIGGGGVVCLYDRTQPYKRSVRGVE